MCSSGEATGSVVSPRTATDSARTTKVINGGLPLAAHWRASTREVLPVARVLVAGARQGTTSAGSVLRTSLRRSQPGCGRAASSWPPRTCPYRPLITKKSSRAVRGTPRNPMSRDEVIDKARDLMAPVLGDDRSERLIETVYAIEEMADVRGLRALLMGSE